MSASDPQPPAVSGLTEPDFAKLLDDHHHYFDRLDDKATVKLLAAAWKLGASDRVAAVADAVARLTAEKVELDWWRQHNFDEAVKQCALKEAAEAEVTRLREERDALSADYDRAVNAFENAARACQVADGSNIVITEVPARITELRAEVASLRATLAATEEKK